MRLWQEEDEEVLCQPEYHLPLATKVNRQLQCPPRGITSVQSRPRLEPQEL